MWKSNYKYYAKKPQHNNDRLPLRMVMYKTVYREELKKYNSTKQDIYEEPVNSQ